jgi:hypothetical protein
MSYCRFRNTLEDLRACDEAMDEDDIGEEEKAARTKLLKLIYCMARDWLDEDGEPNL